MQGVASCSDSESSRANDIVPLRTLVDVSSVRFMEKDRRGAGKGELECEVIVRKPAFSPREKRDLANTTRVQFLEMLRMLASSRRACKGSFAMIVVDEIRYRSMIRVWPSVIRAVRG